METPRPTFWVFIRVILSDWMARMSGPASVPLTVAATYVDGPWAKAGLIALAFFCAWYAAYRVWAAERERVIEAENALGKSKDKQELLLILNEIFNNSKELCERPLDAKDSLSRWRKDIESLFKYTIEILQSKLSNAELNVLINGPMGERYVFHNRSSGEQQDLQHVIYFFHERIVDLIKKNS
ncbi:hypothetical protein DSM21852_34440 [Methylocystis bryophila]|uniref:Uncharacterized protein n=2 Tax=Methylocystis bryophila TaxID=655015 RepID=A0A1W6MRP1_9HYPH|nr:hypothetical protein B1812_03075 [Methylocystis bryophila]BDV40191.1 hypothetical protein DSM21852_34440 [Methylocystis bryophila]